WQELARLYQLAEQKGFVQARIAMYPGVHGESSIREELLKSLMIAVSSTDGLPPLKQQIAERAVAQYAGAFTVSRSREGCTCSFDLAVPKAPTRLFNGAAASPTMLYFGAGEALEQLRQLTRQVVETGAVPRDVNLGGNYEKEVVISALK